MNERPLNPDSHPVSTNSHQDGPRHVTWVTKEQIATHFRIGLRTVTSLMERRVLPYTKVRHLVRFNIAACDAAFGFFNRGHTAPSTAQPPRWATKMEVAAHLNVSPRTITNLMRAQFLPHVKIGRLIRFDLQICDEQMHRRRTPAVSERRGS
jgi:excisionase family DNA binding protein